MLSVNIKSNEVSVFIFVGTGSHNFLLFFLYFYCSFTSSNQFLSEFQVFVGKLTILDINLTAALVSSYNLEFKR